MQVTKIVPGCAYKFSLPAVTDVNGVLLDNTTGVGTATVTAKDGHATSVLISPPFNWEGASGNWHGVLYGQYTVPANLPLRIHGQVTDLSAAVVRDQMDWSLEPIQPLRQTYWPGQPYRVNLTGVLFLGAVPAAGSWTATVTVTDLGGQGTVQVNAATMVVTGTQTAQYDIAQTVLVAGGWLYVTAVAKDLAGNQLYAQNWLLTARR